MTLITEITRDGYFDQFRDDIGKCTRCFHVYELKPNRWHCPKCGHVEFSLVKKDGVRPAGSDLGGEA